MKISKLFHWLYGVIMLLPIFAIGVTSLISTFNMSAKEETEITYKYQTNEVNSNEDLIIGNTYSLTIPIEIVAQNGEKSEYEFLQTQDSQTNIFQLVDYNTNLFQYNFINLTDFIDYGTIYIGQFNSGNEDYICKFDDVNDTEIEFKITGTYNRIGNYYVKLILTYLSNEDTINNDLITNNYFSALPIELNPVENVETHNLDTQKVFYRAIDKVQQSPLFNWAYNSFLVTPFAYIVSLFSMPTNSFVVMLLSYWLAISIIWLVFDLVMYVPLLIHRWLDKGVLE